MAHVAGTQTGILDHYRKLAFFNFHRHEAGNYRKMREYFAQVILGEIESFVPVDGKQILDVGGAFGEFCQEISGLRDCEATNLDPRGGHPVWQNTIRAQADHIPLRDGSTDLVLCRGVLEHIPLEDQQPSLDEIYRVTRTKGHAYLVIPPWYNPHAGHQLKPFHYLPFGMARSLRRRVFGNDVSARSYAEASLYPITFARMKRMIHASHFRLLATMDTHFRLHFMTRVPVLREILVPSVAFIVRKD